MEVVNKFDATLKGQVLVELGSLDDIPLEGVIEVGARLKEKSTYLPRTTEFSRGGKRYCGYARRDGFKRARKVYANSSK